MCVLFCGQSNPNGLDVITLMGDNHAMDCFKNGDIVPCEEAMVHVSDLGLLRSYAAFDYLRTYNGRPFRLNDYLARFRNSAQELNLPFEYSNEHVAAVINDLLQRSGLEDAGVRLVITGGNSPDSITPVEPNFFILIEPVPQYPREYYERGVKLITSDYLRDVPTIKSTGYLNAIKLMPYVKQHGALDMLYCHDGQVLELTRNNIFFFQGDTLVTPSDNVLRGITRMVLLELCREEFDVEERPVRTNEIPVAGEAFLSGTTKGVMPVVQIDDTVLGEGLPGHRTRRVMALFRRYTGEN
jgi:branched-subunit amino acid aminotransferase/4-amino-4-deoxychorismate lyase